MNILVTGGASGFGEAITTILLNAGHTVYFTYYRSEQKAKELEQQFSNAKALRCNFEDTASVDALLSTMETFNLEALINNAITGLRQNYFHKMETNDFTNSFQKNILPTIKITQKAILLFRKQKNGRIITVISSYITGLPPIGLSIYVAEKNYLLSLSKSWATENIKFNIASNSVSPSFMLTGLTAATDERIIEEIANNQPGKKLLTTQEAAQGVLHFITTVPEITGTNLPIGSASDLPK